MVLPYFYIVSELSLWRGEIKKSHQRTPEIKPTNETAANTYTIVNLAHQQKNRFNDVIQHFTFRYSAGGVKKSPGDGTRTRSGGRRCQVRPPEGGWGNCHYGANPTLEPAPNYEQPSGGFRPDARN